MAWTLPMNSGMVANPGWEILSRPIPRVGTPAFEPKPIPSSRRGVSSELNDTASHSERIKHPRIGDHKARARLAAGITERVGVAVQLRCFVASLLRS